MKFPFLAATAALALSSTPALAQGYCYDETVAAIKVYGSANGFVVNPSSVRNQLEIRDVNVAANVLAAQVNVPVACGPHTAANVIAYAELGPRSEPAPQPTPTPSATPTPAPAPTSSSAPAGALVVAPQIAEQKQRIERLETTLEQLKARPDPAGKLKPLITALEGKLDLLKSGFDAYVAAQAERDQGQDERVDALDIRTYGSWQKDAKGKRVMVKGHIQELQAADGTMQADIAAIKSSDSGVMSGLSWVGGLLAWLLIIIAAIFGISKIFKREEPSDEGAA